MKIISETHFIRNLNKFIYYFITTFILQYKLLMLKYLTTLDIFHINIIFGVLVIQKGYKISCTLFLIV
jgi:hypothetical protein